MCSFFSFVGDGYGNYRYFDWEYRKAHLKEDCDSHTVVLTHFKVPPKMQDKWSKYEYNPITKKFTVDQGREGHDHEAAENFARALNFKDIVEPLIIKDIVNPLTKKRRKPTQRTIDELHSWIAVWSAVGGAVWSAVGGAVGGTVWSAVRDAVRDAVWDAVRDAVGDAVGGAVWDAVGGAVWGAVGGAVGGAVRGAVRGYVSSFFDVRYSFDFSSCVKLWNTGYVPSFDGKVWRLHSGPKMAIVYEEKV
jgi:hypothetical protein